MSLLGWPLVSAAASSSATGTPYVVVAENEDLLSEQYVSTKQVITAQGIRQSGVQTITEALQVLGGIQVNDYYGNSAKSNINLRGFGENSNSNILILIDGRPLNNPDMGAPDLRQVIMSDVDKIEILKGSGTVLYGDQAVGGVINITTKGGASKNSYAMDEWGSYNTKRLIASLATGNDNLTFRITGNRSLTDNYRDHNDDAYTAWFLRSDYQFGTGNILLEYQNLEDDLQTPGGLTKEQIDDDPRQINPNYEDDFIDYRMNVSRIAWDQLLSNNTSFSLDASHSSYHGTFLLSSYWGKSLQSVSQDRTTNIVSPRVIHTYEVNGREGDLTVGVDYEKSRYAMVSGFGPQKGKPERKAAFAQGTIPLADALKLTLGAREADWKSNASSSSQNVSDDHRETGYEAAMQWAPHHSITILTRAEKNLRFPKVDELLGVPDPTYTLKPQTGYSYEIGVNLRQSGNQLSLNLFQLKLDNEIAYDPGAGTWGGNINYDKTLRNGMSIALNSKITEFLAVFANANYVDATFDSGNYKGEQIPAVANISSSLGVTYSIDNFWSVAATAYGVGSQRLSGDYNADEKKLPGYAIFNARITYRIKGLSTSLQVNNLLGKQYETIGVKGTWGAPNTYFTAPERNAMLTLSYSF